MKHLPTWLRALLLLGLLFFAASVRAVSLADLLPPERAFVPTAAMADAHHLDVHYQIAPGYYMYEERFQVEVEDAAGQLLLYRASTLTPPDAEARTPAWPQGPELPAARVVHDPVFDQDMGTYREGVTLRIPLQPGAAAPLHVTLMSQGCADLGVCYPPMTQTLQLTAADGGYAVLGPLARTSVPTPQQTAQGAGDGAPAAAASPLPPAAAPAARAEGRPDGAGAALSAWRGADDLGMAAWLQHAPLWQILLLAALMGVALSFTPCVLPMVPILLAVIAGTGGAPSTGRRGHGRGLGLAAVYVLGVSLVYTILGVLAGLAGAGLAAWLQSPWVIGAFALLLALFALAMLGAFTLQVPVAWQSRLQARLQALPGGRVGSVFIMGALSALIVGPCVAAPLAGVLLFISQTGDVLVGGASLFAMAWGEGLLLLIVGAGAGALLPRAGAWMAPLAHALGLLLLATAWWMARPLLPVALSIAGWALLALWAALLLWQLGAAQAGGGADGVRPTRAAGPLRPLVRSVALLLAVWGLAQGLGLLAGGRDMLRPLAPFATQAAAVAAAGGTVAEGAAGPAGAQAVRAQFATVHTLAELQARVAASTRPVMFDFYADWCVSCLEMEKFTFSDPQVAARMGQMLLLQADVTRMSEDDRALLAAFQLFGPPGTLFFAPGQNRLQPVARVVGYLNATAFGRVQQRVLDASAGTARQ